MLCNDISVAFHMRLRQLRKEKKITQTVLGKYLCYGYTAISNYESGRNQPSIEDLKKIAYFFNVSVDYLIGNSNIRDTMNYLNQDEALLVQNFRLLPTERQKEILYFMNYQMFAKQNY